MIDVDKNKVDIIYLLKSTETEGIENLIAYMDMSGFFESPCSGAYHLACEGGLAEHSLNVYRRMTRFVNATDFPISRNSIVIVSLLHDLGKMGDHFKPNYVPNMVRSKTKNKDTGEYDMVQSSAKPYETNKDLNYEEHEIRSVMIAERFISLTEEEETAILHHNGLWGKLDSAFSSTFDKHELATLLHFADLWCSRFEEVSADDTN